MVVEHHQNTDIEKTLNTKSLREGAGECVCVFVKMPKARMHIYLLEPIDDCDSLSSEISQREE